MHLACGGHKSTNYVNIFVSNAYNVNSKKKKTQKSLQPTTSLKLQQSILVVSPGDTEQLY